MVHSHTGQVPKLLSGSGSDPARSPHPLPMQHLRPIRQTGVELWLEQRVSRAVAASINYSWQSEPEILDDPNPHLPAELNLPPTHRFNAGVTWNGSRLLGSASVNVATDAFWSDVLTSAYHGHTDGYATVAASG